MGRITEVFRALRARDEAALIPYLTVGYPSMEGTRELLCAIVDAGADLVELGIPFSDPLADGATLQRTSHLALERGASLRGALELVAALRDRVRVPLLLMSYYNPLLRMGDDLFAREAAAAGVDGVIVPDLPVEESALLGAACRAEGIDLVGMVAPTTPEERVSAIAARTTGFVYCVALRGVTGARSHLPDTLQGLVGRVRRATDLPVAVGFGISSAEQARRVAAIADGVVVGSALMDGIDGNPADPAAAAARFVADLKAGCRRAVR